LALKLARDTTWKPGPIVVKQIFKIWPSYAFTIVFIALLYVRLGEGPMWSHSDIGERCERSLFSNILMINNLFGHSKTCLDAGFVFALEIQFFFLLVAALYMNRRWRGALVITILAIICLSTIYTFIVAFIHKTALTLIPTSPELISFRQGKEKYVTFVDWIYLNPLARAPAFLIGLIVPLQFGRLSIFRKPNRTKTLSLIFWTISVFCFLLIIWTPYFLEFEAIVGDVRPFLAFYAATHRGIWAAVVVFSALILNQSNNSLNDFLSWKVFHPMNKLVYIVLLISEPVSVSLFSSLHRPIYTTPLNTMMTCVGTVCCSFLIALLIDIVVSRPIRRIFENFASATD